MLRDLGAGKAPSAHEYGHSYHLLAEKLYAMKSGNIRLIINNDDVCCHCSQLKDGYCIDRIDHRRDFTMKELFNNYLDARIMETMGFLDNETVTLQIILDKSNLYVDNIFTLYDGNDESHTLKRKENVIKGIQILKEQMIRDSH